MEFLTLKKDGLDEVMLKFIPEDILTRVRPWFILMTNSDIAPVVYDAYYGQSWRTMEDEKTIWPPDCGHQLHDLYCLPNWSVAIAISYISCDRTNRNE